VPLAVSAPITFFAARVRVVDSPSGRRRRGDFRPESRRHGVLQFFASAALPFFSDICERNRQVKIEVETGSLGVGRAACSPQTASTTLRALIDPKRPLRPTAAAVPRARATAPAAGPCSTPAKRVIAMSLWRPSAGCFSAATASSFAKCSPRGHPPQVREVSNHPPPPRRPRRNRGGRFASGFSGSSSLCPLPWNLSALCASSSPPARLITVSAADPLNLVGILVPGDRVASNSGKFVSFATALPSRQRNDRASFPSPRPANFWRCSGTISPCCGAPPVISLMKAVSSVR